jgi:hypothetical protein
LPSPLPLPLFFSLGIVDLTAFVAVDPGSAPSGEEGGSSRKGCCGSGGTREEGASLQFKF